MATTSAVAVANTEFDQALKKMVYLLHSNHPSSATDLRQILDEQIKQKAGSDKILSNTLSQRHLDYEKSFPGMISTPPPQEISDEIINLTNSPKTISDVDSDDGAATVSDAVNLLAADSDGEDDGNLKEFGDLNCCVCSEMMFTASNRLIECSKCGALYHQECHKPPITDEEAIEDQENSWQCHACSSKSKTSLQTAAVVVIDDEPVALVSKSKSSAASSSSSSSSSPFYKQEQPSSSSSSSSKHQTKERSSSSKSSSTPAVNLVEKSTTSTSSTRKSSSHSSSSKSSSKSRHHDSKRKSKS